MRRIGSTAVGLLALLMLAGCFIQLPEVIDDPVTTPTVDPSGDAPAGWADLPPCPGGPTDPWVWVDGFPAEHLEAAGYSPICGATYFDTGSPIYTSVADPEVSLEELEAIAAELEAVGYVLTDTTFDPVAPGDPTGLAGSWQYSRPDPAGDEFVWIVNFWSGGEPVLYYSYVDYEGPGTRALP